MISKMREKMQKSLENQDTKVVLTNIVCSFGIKGVSMLIGLFTTPVYIRYFNNNEVLGIWFTLLSVLAWILNCDMGIGNGLRNKLVVALKSDQQDEARKYVSSAYIFSFGIAIMVMLCIMSISPFMNWNVIFNISGDVLEKHMLSDALQILLLSVCLQLVLRLITSILHALQKSFLPSLLNLATNIVMLLFSLFSSQYGTNGSIINMAYAYLFAVNVPLVVATLIVFVSDKYRLRPALRCYRHSYAVSTLKIGGVFLWLQLMAMILNSTNSYFVTLFVGNAEVVEYNIYVKIFTLIGTFVMLASSPIWSASTKAQVEKNYSWLYSLFKKFSILSIVGIVCNFVLILPLQWIFDFWLGESSISVNTWSALLFAVYGGVLIWSNTITCFVNGLGELKLQSIFLTLGAAIDILMTYVLAHLTHSYHAIVFANIAAFLPYLVIQSIWLVRFLCKKRSEYS